MNKIRLELKYDSPPTIRNTNGIQIKSIEFGEKVKAEHLTVTFDTGFKRSELESLLSEMFGIIPVIINNRSPMPAVVATTPVAASAVKECRIKLDRCPTTKLGVFNMFKGTKLWFNKEIDNAIPKSKSQKRKSEKASNDYDEDKKQKTCMADDETEDLVHATTLTAPASSFHQDNYADYSDDFEFNDLEMETEANDDAVDQVASSGATSPNGDDGSVDDNIELIDMTILTRRQK